MAAAVGVRAEVEAEAKAKAEAVGEPAGTCGVACSIEDRFPKASSKGRDSQHGANARALALVAVVNCA